MSNAIHKSLPANESTPLCASKPKHPFLALPEHWQAVTCRKCLALPSEEYKKHTVKVNDYRTGESYYFEI